MTDSTENPSTTRDNWFCELFEYQTTEDRDVGTASSDATDVQLLETHLDIDFVATPNRRSGKPTVAGTRLEPHIIGERIFELTLSNMRSTTEGVFDTEMFENIRDHYTSHPHDVPQIKPHGPEWFEQFKLHDELSDFYWENAEVAYKLAVIDMAQRREYTFSRMIDAMCEFYDSNMEHMEFLRRSSYDSAACLAQLGETDDPIAHIESQNDTEGHFVATSGEVFTSLSEFLQEHWDGEWPPDEDPIYIDHKATFGEERPPGPLR